MESSLFDFFREVVLPRDAGDSRAAAGRSAAAAIRRPTSTEARERLRFAMKLQQYTGPVQAKGLEDTAFYRYNVLLSLNEVGGDPSRFGRSVEEFHDANAQRAAEWPFEMLATATHDTKLGEDVRARINVLSEMPDEWAREVSKWMRINNARSGRSSMASRRRIARTSTASTRRSWACGRRSPGTIAGKAPAGLVERLSTTCSKPRAKPRCTPAG